MNNDSKNILLMNATNCLQEDDEEQNEDEIHINEKPNCEEKVNDENGKYLCIIKFKVQSPWET